MFDFSFFFGLVTQYTKTILNNSITIIGKI
jgi:hypothetical protein